MAVQLLSLTRWGSGVNVKVSIYLIKTVDPHLTGSKITIDSDQAEGTILVTETPDQVLTLANA